MEGPEMEIQWYPGHMAKMKRELKEKINLVDVVVELLDARIPRGSKNPAIDEFAQHKQRIIVLNKSDLADNDLNQAWDAYYRREGFAVIISDAVHGSGIAKVYDTAKRLMAEKIANKKKKGVLNVMTRAMVVGIPNVGKSAYINAVLGKKSAKAENRPGVTRSQQWIKIKKDFELLDTPGILWPKFEDKEAGIHLALTGAIRDRLLDFNALSLVLIHKMREGYADRLQERYRIELGENAPDEQILADIAKSRGFLLKGGVLDTERAAAMIIDEFRSGKLGRITLETPDAGS